MTRLSVYAEAEKEIADHKWRQSELAGRDMGVAAVADWSKSFWLCFHRWRFVEHLRGEVFWEEFGDECYAIVSSGFASDRRLLDEILDLIRAGEENLSVIWLGHNCGWPMKQVLEILEALDINSRKLPPPAVEDVESCDCQFQAAAS